MSVADMPPGRAPFTDPRLTAKGEPRARVALGRLRTLWVNTGTLCNIACPHCYIESSPRNDRLAYFTAADLRAYLDEIAGLGLGTEEIGFTGGEPFMNPEIGAMLELALARGFRVLVLTNAMRPMDRHRAGLLALRARHDAKLAVRVSIDHFKEFYHDRERGPGSFRAALDGLRWLAENGFRPAVACRTLWGESAAEMRAGFAQLLEREGIPLDCDDPAQLVVFPEMDARAPVPEITEACWGLLGKDPGEVMCASSRMVVRRKGAAVPAVLACTLLPYDSRFELGPTLGGAAREVALNHPHCAKFCVLGGGACSRG